MNVNIADLVAQYKSIKPEIDEAISRVLYSGAYILGENVKAFETEFAEYCGVRYAIALNSGTDALQLSLQALGVRQGDEVILPAFTIMADAAVVVHLGATPVFVDINPLTLNLDPTDLASKITPRTKAIVAVDLYGQTANYDTIRPYHIPIVEDACQAVGAEYKGYRAGALADASCFSFYPTKNLSCYGDGGMVTTNDKEVADDIRLLRHHGDIGHYNNVEIGYNSRLDELQAAILRVKLGHVDVWNYDRRYHAKAYNAALSHLAGLIVPQEQEGCHHVYHQYTVRVQKRDEVRRYLQEHGVASFVYYPTPLHLQKALSHLGYGIGDFPQSEKAAQQVLSIPVYAEMDETQIDYVIEQIQEYFGCYDG